MVNTDQRQVFHVPPARLCTYKPERMGLLE
jgi:hypothetical protein